MEPESNSRFARARFVSSIAVAALASAALMLVLNIFSFLGAKEFLEGVSNETTLALKALNPLELGQRYVAIFSAHLNPCPNGPAGQYISCGDARQNSGIGYFIWTTVLSLFELLSEIFGESVTRACVDLMQLVAGFWLAIIVSIRMNFPLAPQVQALIVFLGVALTCLISIPMLAIMSFASTVLGEIVPAHSGLSLFGGSWLGFIFACSGRTLEGGLHHLIGSVVERLVGK